MRRIFICIRFYLPIVLWAYCYGYTAELKAKEFLTIYGSLDLVADTICGNGKPYPLLGTQPNIGETGLWKIIRGSGNILDTSKYSTSVSNLPGNDLSILVWIISSGGNPIKFDTIKVFNGTVPSKAAIVYPTTITTDRICSNRDSIVAADVISGNGSWSATSGILSDTKKSFVIVSNLPQGKTTLTWKITSKGCQEVQSTSIDIFNNTPSKPFAGNDTSVCKNSAILKASKSTIGKGLWSTADVTVRINPDTLNTATVTSLKDGVNTLIWSVTNNGCTLKDTVTINNLSPHGANVNDQEVTTCSDSTVLNNPIVYQGSGTWYASPGSLVVLKPNALNVKVKNLAEGDNFIKWKVENAGCPVFIDSVKVTNKLPSKAVILTPDTAVCAKTVTLRAKKPTQGSYEWTVLQSGKILNPDLVVTNVTGLIQDKNIFVWTVSYGGCTAQSDTVIVTNQVPDTVYAGPDREICGNQISLSAMKPKPGYVAGWELVNEQSTVVFNDRSIPNAAISKLELGDNLFIWKISKTGSNCPANVAFAYDTVKITNNTPYPINAGNDSAFCTSSVFLNPKQSINFVGQRVRWNALKTPTGSIPVFDSTVATQIVNGLTVSGKYQFKLTVYKNNCSITDTVTFQRNQFTKITAIAPSHTCSPEDTLKGNNPLQEFTTGKSLWRVLSEPQKNGVKIVNPKSYITSIENMSFVESTYIFEYDIWNLGCDTLRDTVSIIRDKYSTGNVLVPPLISVCKDTVALNAQKPIQGKGVWSRTNSNANFLPLSNPAETYNATAINLSVFDGDNASINIFKWTVENGKCENSVQDVNVKRFLPPPPVKLDFHSDSICDDATLILSGKPPSDPKYGSGKWYLNNKAVSDSVNLNIKYFPITYGRNVFIYKITNDPSCLPTSDSVVIYKLQTPKAPVISKSDTSICSSLIILTVDSTSDLLASNWKALNNKQFLPRQSSPTSQIFTLSGLSVGNYIFKYEVTAGICKNSDTVFVHVGTITSRAKITTSQNDVCAEGQNTSFKIEASKPDSMSKGTWITTGNMGILSRKDSNVAIISLQPGTNKIIWQTEGASDFCFSRDSLTIDVVKPPSLAHAEPDKTLHEPQGTLEASTPEDGIGVWKLISGTAKIEDPNSPTTKYTELGMGKNIFLWTVFNGPCNPTYDTLIIYRIAFEVPKAFSPNKDRINDKFTIQGVSEYYPRELVVFNRWGMEVYKNTFYNNEWEGEGPDGRDLAEDTYYYLLKLENKSVHTGFVVIKR